MNYQQQPLVRSLRTVPRNQRWISHFSSLELRGLQWGFSSITYCLLLSDSGCVNKFVHSPNCVNELNIIKLTTCHDFLLAELRRLFRKDLCGETSECTAWRLSSPRRVRGAATETSDAEVDVRKNVLLQIQFYSLYNDPRSVLWFHLLGCELL